MIADDAIERVAVALDGAPFGDGAAPSAHAWRRTINLPWLVVAVCSGCGALGSASENGVMFIERSPSSMVYRTDPPRACVRVAPKMSKDEGGVPCRPKGPATAGGGNEPAPVTAGVQLALAGVSDAAA